MLAYDSFYVVLIFKRNLIVVIKEEVENFKKVVLILSIRDGKPGVGHFVIDGNQIIFLRLRGDI
jgi:hypothetical protein